MLIYASSPINSGANSYKLNSILKLALRLVRRLHTYLLRIRLLRCRLFYGLVSEQILRQPTR